MDEDTKEALRILFECMEELRRLDPCAGLQQIRALRLQVRPPLAALGVASAAGIAPVALVAGCLVSLASRTLDRQARPTLPFVHNSARRLDAAGARGLLRATVT